MKRLFLYIILIFGIWVFLSQCLIFKNRLSDGTSLSLFRSRNAPLRIFDTVINNRHLHYAVTGADSLPTLIFIHGSPGSWTNYRAYMWDTTSRRKYRMVSIDRPGFGFSDFGNAMHLKDQCDIILPVLRKFKTDKPLYLCGHSMGAPIAVELAADAPELFAKIVLVGCSIDVKLEKKETWRRIMNVKPMYWALPGAFGPSNTELLYLKNDLYKLQPSFKNVTCDVYFIHGDEDDWVPIQNIAYGKQMMTNARSITADTIFGAGHLIPWENRTAFTDLLLHIDSTKKYAKVQISQCVN